MPSQLLSSHFNWISLHSSHHWVSVCLSTQECTGFDRHPKCVFVCVCLYICVNEHSTERKTGWIPPAPLRCKGAHLDLETCSHFTFAHTYLSPFYTNVHTDSTPTHLVTCALTQRKFCTHSPWHPHNHPHTHVHSQIALTLYPPTRFLHPLLARHTHTHTPFTLNAGHVPDLVSSLLCERPAVIK